jgi:hypothetical protein
LNVVHATKNTIKYSILDATYLSGLAGSDGIEMARVEEVQEITIDAWMAMIGAVHEKDEARKVSYSLLKIFAIKPPFRHHSAAYTLQSTLQGQGF